MFFYGTGGDSGSNSAAENDVDAKLQEQLTSVKVGEPGEPLPIQAPFGSPLRILSFGRTSLASGIGTTCSNTPARVPATARAPTNLGKYWAGVREEAI